jgi:hypothetical protein
MSRNATHHHSAIAYNLCTDIVLRFFGVAIGIGIGIETNPGTDY